jgi:signal transduction histidine kinase
VDAPEVDAFGPDVRALVLAFVPAISAAVQNALTFGQEREAAERLREADQLKEDFLAIVSHELRTPLTTMLGFAETLAGHLDELSPGQSVDLAQRIKGAGDRLARLIEDLLYASRIERGLVEIRPGPVDVAGCVRVAVDEVGDPDHPVTIEVAEPLPPARVDADRLVQVLVNLLSNAAKFSPSGSPIAIRAALAGGRVQVEIEDRGRGIPVTAHDDIFRLFYQAEGASTRSAGGLGIGLHVVKRLCDAMDITVEVDTSDDVGTCFRLRLPVAGRA